MKNELIKLPTKMHVPAHSSHKKVQLLRAAVSKQPAGLPRARRPDIAPLASPRTYDTTKRKPRA